MDLPAWIYIKIPPAAPRILLPDPARTFRGEFFPLAQGLRQGKTREGRPEHRLSFPDGILRRPLLAIESRNCRERGGVGGAEFPRPDHGAAFATILRGV